MNEKNNWKIIELLSTESFLSLNKILLRHYGPEKAVFISNLIDKYRYFLKKKKLENDCFYQSHENQINETGITLYGIRKCKKDFVKEGVLSIEKKGLPSKEFYKLNLTKLSDIIENSSKNETRKSIVTVRLQDSVVVQDNDPVAHSIKENKYKENKEKIYKKEKNKSLSIWKDFKSKLPEEFIKDKQLKQTIIKFIDYRSNDKKDPLTKKAVTLICNKFKSSSPFQFKQALETSIMSGWKGVFPQNNNKKYNTNQTNNALMSDQAIKELEERTEVWESVKLN